MNTPCVCCGVAPDATQEQLANVTADRDQLRARIQRCAKCGDADVLVDNPNDRYPCCSDCYDDLRAEDARVWRERLDAAEAERDEARAGDSALRSRVSELEAALRDVTEALRSRTTPPWCTRCGADWTGEAHGCPVGRAVRLLEGSGAAPAEGLRGLAAREAGPR